MAIEPLNQPAGLARALLDWFARHARDLPWRHTRDPYAIWIAEVMLQQTQVRTVQPYWERWMRVLPTVNALAAAPRERILKLWEGLGYYGRARRLHEAAQRIVRDHGGQLPRDPAALLALPGVGRYTAGAICSIAFDQPMPVLDGNVARVLSRHFGLRATLRSSRAQHRLWRWATELVAAVGTARPSRRAGLERGPGALNQALMELGALVCTPRQPQCPTCPWRQSCRARQRGLIDRIPRAEPRARTLARRSMVFVVERADRYLIRQRPGEGVNAHLWEFPSVEVQTTEPDLATVSQRCFGKRLVDLRPWGCIRHSITRHRITLDIFRGAWSGKDGKLANAGRWVTFAELAQLPLAAAHRRIADRLPRSAPLQG